VLLGYHIIQVTSFSIGHGVRNKECPFLLDEAVQIGEEIVGVKDLPILMVGEMAAEEFGDSD